MDVNEMKEEEESLDKVWKNLRMYIIFKIGVQGVSALPFRDWFV